jgi:hypothetical protein
VCGKADDVEPKPIKLLLVLSKPAKDIEVSGAGAGKAVEGAAVAGAAVAGRSSRRLSRASGRLFVIIGGAVCGRRGESAGNWLFDRGD